MRVMISSTAVDLPDHRAQAIEACLRAGAAPEAMEHMPAEDKSAVDASLEMVDRAEVYVGIFAWRYGHVPDGSNISITEMEFNRAVERGVPTLVFLTDDEHPISIGMVDTNRERIDRLRERVCEGRVCAWFVSPEDLRGLVVEALGKLRDELEAAEHPDEPVAPQLHRQSVIPQKPKPYVAHPYTLLQTGDLVGRRKELALLTDWVTRSDQEHVRLLSLVAIGGMGKSALSWKWFQDIAPQELRGKLEGSLWWSFYESDAGFENFVIRALAYTAGESHESVRKGVHPGDREDRLLRILDEEPFLLVLDGLERILIAYARLDAARMIDDDLDDETMNRVFDARGVPVQMRESFMSKHRLRKTADPRVGQFLRRLSRVRSTRVLVTTRLYPADLQTATAQQMPGCAAVFLSGLSEDDALALWREFGVSGSTDQLRDVFASVENYPLLIRALAGEVAGFREAPGDFDAWLDANPDFDPASLDLKNARTHVLEHALTGLHEEPREVLRTITAFRMPATYDTLRALHVGDEKACGSDQDLDAVLTELEDRGLVGWDKDANRYDVHPIVRSVVWNRLQPGDRERIHSNLHDYFDAIPRPSEGHEAESLEDLTAEIELYRSLLGLERYDDAMKVFQGRLSRATLYRLAAHRERIELLEPLFPDGPTKPPQLADARGQGYALNALALAFQAAGEPGRSLAPFRLAFDMYEQDDYEHGASVGWRNLAEVLRQSGQLRESHHAALTGLTLARRLDDEFGEAIGLYHLGLMLAECGVVADSESALQRAIRICSGDEWRQIEGLTTAYLAERAIWFGDLPSAQRHADRAWDLAHHRRYERDFIRALRLQGVAALGLDEIDVADERLHLAIARARATNTVDEELATLVLLADLERRRGRTAQARDHLEHVWESASRGPYPLHHADGCNLLARVETDVGERGAAIAAATEAYELAWCDGPPYSIHHALEAAESLLRDLDAPIPQLPPFDESNFEPLPDTPIDPEDE